MLTLDVFVVLTKEDNTSTHELLRTVHACLALRYANPTRSLSSRAW